MDEIGTWKKQELRREVKNQNKHIFRKTNIIERSHKDGGSSPTQREIQRAAHLTRKPHISDGLAINDIFHSEAQQDEYSRLVQMIGIYR